MEFAAFLSILLSLTANLFPLNDFSSSRKTLLVFKRRAFGGGGGGVTKLKSCRAPAFAAKTGSQEVSHSRIAGIGRGSRLRILVDSARDCVPAASCEPRGTPAEGLSHSCPLADGRAIGMAERDDFGAQLVRKELPAAGE